MTEYILDLYDIESEGELHVYLEEMLEFPPCYGRNFDALYDVLTDISQDTRLILCRLPQKAFFHTFIRVVADAAACNPHLEYTVFDRA